jgi:hypothetical protein
LENFGLKYTSPSPRGKLTISKAHNSFDPKTTKGQGKKSNCLIGPCDVVAQLDASHHDALYFSHAPVLPFSLLSTNLPHRPSTTMRLSIAVTFLFSAANVLPTMVTGKLNEIPGQDAADKAVLADQQDRRELFLDNIVHDFHEFGYFGGQPFLTMEITNGNIKSFESVIGLGSCNSNTCYGLLTAIPRVKNDPFKNEDPELKANLGAINAAGSVWIFGCPSPLQVPTLEEQTCTCSGTDTCTFAATPIGGSIQIATTPANNPGPCNSATGSIRIKCTSP